MKRVSRLLQITCIAGLVASPLAGCGKKKSKSDGGGGDTPTTTTTAAGSTNVTLSGSLSLASDTDAALNLNAADAYKIYAITFEDTPKACTAEVGTDSKFNAECKDFAGVSWGAFLRQGSKTLGTIEFAVDSDSSTNMTTGGGTLSMNVAFDPKTGIAKAKVDVSKSDSLSADKVAAAKKLKGAVETNLGDLTGTYKATCKTKEGFECPAAGSNDGPGSEMMLYLKQWELAGKKMLSIWDTKATHDKSFPAGGSEAMPSFKLALPSGEIALDLTSDATFKTSLDSAYAAMPGSLKTAIKASADGQNSWLGEQCEREEASSSTFTDANCKFIAAATETHTYFDFDKQVTVTQTFPKFYSIDDFAALTDATETATESMADCDSDPESDAPFCPHNATGGKFKVYKNSAGLEMRLLCKASENGSDVLMQDAAQGATKLAAIDARKGQKSANCTKITVAGEEMYQGKVNEIRQAVLELSNSPRDEGGGSDSGAIPTDADRCSKYTIASDFSFSSCPEMGGDDRNVPNVCRSALYEIRMFGLEIDRSNGKIKATADSSNSYIYEDAAAAICPTFKGTFGDWHMGDMATRDSSCRNELVGLSTAKLQADRINTMSQSRMDFKDKIICVETNAENKAIVKSIEANSIAPRARLERFWDEETGTERVNLMCEGAGEGPCVKDGLFLGRIEGRHVRGDLKAGMNGAFEVFESEQHSYQMYDPENKKTKTCTNAHAFMMAGRIKDASNFESTLSSKETSNCESTGGDSSGGGDSGGDSGGSGGGSGSGGGEGGGEGGGGFSMFFDFAKQ